MGTPCYKHSPLPTFPWGFHRPTQAELRCHKPSSKELWRKLVPLVYVDQYCRSKAWTIRISSWKNMEVCLNHKSKCFGVQFPERIHVCEQSNEIWVRFRRFFSEIPSQAYPALLIDWNSKKKKKKIPNKAKIIKRAQTPPHHVTLIVTVGAAVGAVIFLLRQLGVIRAVTSMACLDDYSWVCFSQWR